MRKTKYRQGKFKPVYPEKYVGDQTEITFRSDWERRMMMWCDLNPSVIKWNSEGMKLPYWSEADQKQRTYWIDFIIQYRASNDTIKTALIEIKPNAQTKAPTKKGKKSDRYLQECYTWEVNKSKWTAARAYAEKYGMEFIIMDEFDLGIKKRK